MPLPFFPRFLSLFSLTSSHTFYLCTHSARALAHSFPTHSLSLPPTLYLPAVLFFLHSVLLLSMLFSLFSFCFLRCYSLYVSYSPFHSCTIPTTSSPSPLGDFPTHCSHSSPFYLFPFSWDLGPGSDDTESMGRLSWPGGGWGRRQTG